MWSRPVSVQSCVSAPSPSKGRHANREVPSTLSSQATCECEECVSGVVGSLRERRAVYDPTDLVFERPMEDTRTSSTRVEERSGLTFVSLSSESISVPRLPSTSSPTDITPRFRQILPRMPSPTEHVQSPPPADPASGEPSQLYPANLFYRTRAKTSLTCEDITSKVRAAATANHTNAQIPATHLTAEELGAERGWGFYRCQRQVRNGPKCVWYRTCGPFSIPSPPAVVGADVDSLFIHHDQTLRYKMWVLNREREWVPARIGDRQPSNPDRRLWVRKAGEPGWVTKETYSVYRSQHYGDTRRKLRQLDRLHR